MIADNDLGTKKEEATETTGTDCITVHFVRNTICFWQGYPVTYDTGQILLTGNIPTDNKWDGKKLKLWGHLVYNNTCLMFFVDRSQFCPSITPAP